jgi:site-specific recombinase XerD
MKTIACKKDRYKQTGYSAFCHLFTTHLLEQGTELKYIQSLLGHESTKITEIYTHITTSGFGHIKSPMDALDL